MSLPIALGGLSIVGAIIHYSHSDRAIHQLDSAYPRAANVLSGVIAGAAHAAHMSAGAYLSLAASGGAYALASRAATWITGNLDFALLAGETAGAVAIIPGTLSAIMSYFVFAKSYSNLADRAAVWLTNLASIPHWQQRLLNATARFGYLTAEKLNNLDDAQLRHITSWTLCCLPFREIENLQPRVINALSEAELNKTFVKFKDVSTFEQLNTLAATGNSINANQINNLCAFDLKGLKPIVINRIPPAEFQMFSPHVINSLSQECLGQLTLAAVNNLPPALLLQASYIVLDLLSEETLDDLMETHKDQLRFEDFNERASNQESISGDELNGLSEIGIRGLDHEVLNDLPDEELRKLLPHVINNLSRVTLASINPNVILQLSNDTLRNLKPRILNNFSTDLAPALFRDDRIMSHLSVKPVRWQPGMSTDDIYVPNFESLVIAGKRSLWVKKNLYPNIPLEIRKDPRYA